MVSDTRFSKVMVPCASGVLAAAVIAVFLRTLLSRPGEVAQLMDILTGTHAPDAAWAFEELKDVGDASLGEFLPFLGDTRRMPVEVEVDFSASTTDTALWEPRKMALEAQQGARFILVHRMATPGDIRQLVLNEAPRSRSQWESDLRKFRATHKTVGGIPIEPHCPERSRMFPSLVRPPSQDPRCAGLLARGDAKGLVAALRTASQSEVAWVFESLKAMPDDTLELLLPQAESTEMTRVKHLYGKNGSYSGASLPVGSLVRFVLYERMWRPYTRSRMHEIVDLEYPMDITWDWKKFRGSK